MKVLDVSARASGMSKRVTATDKDVLEPRNDQEEEADVAVGKEVQDTAKKSTKSKNKKVENTADQEEKKDSPMEKGQRSLLSFFGKPKTTNGNINSKSISNNVTKDDTKEKNSSSAKSTSSSSSSSSSSPSSSQRNIEKVPESSKTTEKDESKDLEGEKQNVKENQKVEENHNVEEKQNAKENAPPVSAELEKMDGESETVTETPQNQKMNQQDQQESNQGKTGSNETKEEKAEQGMDSQSFKDSAATAQDGMELVQEHSNDSNDEVPVDDLISVESENEEEENDVFVRRSGRKRFKRSFFEEEFGAGFAGESDEEDEEEEEDMFVEYAPKGKSLKEFSEDARKDLAEIIVELCENPHPKAILINKFRAIDDYAHYPKKLVNSEVSELTSQSGRRWWLKDEFVDLLEDSSKTTHRKRKEEFLEMQKNNKRRKKKVPESETPTKKKPAAKNILDIFQRMNAKSSSSQSKASTTATTTTAATTSATKQNARSKPKLLTAKDDPRIGKYQEYVEKHMNEAKKYINTSIPPSLKTVKSTNGDSKNPKFEDIKNIDDEKTALFLSETIQFGRLPLEKEVKRISAMAPALSKEDIGKKIVLLAERKAFGIKSSKIVSSNSDENEASLWRWEVANLMPFSAESKKFIYENRRKMTHHTRRITAGTRVVKCLQKNINGVNDTRVCAYIEQCEKLDREAALAEQKAAFAQQKAAEKAKQLEEAKSKKAKLAEEAKAKKAKQAEEAKAKKLKQLEEEKARKAAAKEAESDEKPEVNPSMALTNFFKVVEKKKKSSSCADSPSPNGSSKSEGQVVDSEAKSKLKKARESQFYQDLENGKPIVLADYIKSLKEMKNNSKRRKGTSAATVAASAASASVSGTGTSTSTSSSSSSSLPAPSSDDVQVVENPFKESEQDADVLNKALEANKSKKKLFMFYENRRPAYFGTFRSKSKHVSARCWKGKDPKLDYEVDSDDEWEELPSDCESIAGSDGGSEQGDPDEKELDYKDGWLLEDDLVEYESDFANSSDDEGDPSMNTDGKKFKKRKKSSKSNVEVKKSWQLGVVYDEENARNGKLGEHAQKLCDFEIEILPGEDIESLTPSLPLIPPTLEEIKEELISKKRKRTLASPVASRKSLQAIKRQKSDPRQTDDNNNNLANKKFPEEELRYLVELIEGSFSGVNQLVNQFQEEQKQRYALEFSQGRVDKITSETTKKAVKAKILEISVREKRNNDSRPRIYCFDTVLEQEQVDRCPTLRKKPKSATKSKKRKRKKNDDTSKSPFVVAEATSATTEESNDVES